MPRIAALRSICVPSHNSMSPLPSHPARLSRTALLEQCETRRLRRSGPGGQHRNKVETAIVLRHIPTDLSAEANERRSQSANLEVAIHRLRVTLAIHHRSAIVAAGAPSDLWRGRCRNQRIAVNPDHEDFPALLAEALDFIAATDWDVTVAAERLGITTSQLVKFLKLEPRALRQVNENRTTRGLHPLK